MERINYNYLKISNEIPLLLKLKLRTKNNVVKNPKKILVINVCLIGDFVATLPALRQFIKKSKTKVDLIVSPPIKPLAEKIKGVKKIYTVKSIYNRKIENTKNKKQKFPDYDFVLVMRLSGEAYKLLKKINYKSIKSYLSPYLKYAYYLTKSILTKSQAKQWREANFEFVGEEIKNIDFEDIFDFKKTDYNKVKKLPSITGKTKKIIIHTGSGWEIKLWSNNNWVELLKKINKLGKFKFIFVGNTEKEKKDFQEIQKKLDFKIYSLINKVDLKDLMIVMRLSNYFIGIDSGPRNMTHIADLPSISLLGPGPKYFLPLNKRDIVIDKSDCRCTNLFCYKKESCVKKIKTEEVFIEFKKLLRKTNKENSISPS